MRTKWGPFDAGLRARRGSQRIRTDLESRGVAPELSKGVAQRLAPVAAQLSEREYAGLLDGVAAAYGVQADDAQRVQEADIAEIRRLMEGFAGELRKLDEGLRMLSAYLRRMKSRATHETPPTLH